MGICQSKSDAKMHVYKNTWKAAFVPVRVKNVFKWPNSSESQLYFFQNNHHKAEGNLQKIVMTYREVKND